VQHTCRRGGPSPAVELAHVADEAKPGCPRPTSWRGVAIELAAAVTGPSPSAGRRARRMAELKLCATASTRVPPWAVTVLRSHGAPLVR
jgi:hypothetical protein